LEWTVIYSDNTVLKQFKEDGTESLFREIDQDKLSVFRLDSKDINCNMYCVSVKDGSFEINNERITFDGFENSKFKLIYFKRVRQNLGGVVPIEVTYNIGWQIPGDKNTINQQRIMQIHNNSISFKVK